MNKQKKTLRIAMSVLLTIAAIISLILIFNKPIGEKIISDNQQQALSHLNRKQIQQNQKKKGQFDFSKVKSINGVTAMGSKLQNPSVIGAIAIPAVGLKLPICKGLSNVNMSTGASTMREDQQRGKGNYPLAGHYMTNYGALFSPIERTKQGERIYLTDLKNVYEYEIYSKEIVSPKSVNLVDDTQKTQCTLITCANGGAMRWAVRGIYLGKAPANKQNLQLFNL